VAHSAPGLRPEPVSGTLGAVDRAVAEAIDARIFPGAVVLIAEGERLLQHQAYGTTMYDAPGSRPVAPDTIYDVASLTKIFTATAALRLFEAAAIDLDAPASRYLPELRARDVLVRHLLTHTSGLDLRLSVAARGGAEALMAAVYAAPQAHPPGARVAYTNINSLLLGEIVARVYGAPLDLALHQLVIEPLGLRDTRYCPPPQLASRIAPTELDEAWRGRLVHASVHDESAHALGGVAGHAGLFSTAADLHRFCLVWLPDGGEGALGALLAPETIALATANHTPGLHLACGLGWMLDRPNFMGPALAGTFGHTGFTGPAIAVVPGRRLVVVVLNNRVFPRRGPPRHHSVIAMILEASLEHDWAARM
jgi:serine-type D-Ala-D-Ala carboxypeptidase